MTTIKYGSLGGLPVRWRGWEAWEMWCDGRWHEANAAEVVTKAWVMTEAQYRKSFGDVPPLPGVAFGGDGTNDGNRRWSKGRRLCRMYAGRGYKRESRA